MTKEHWFTARKGSQLGYWKPEGLLLGIIEVHPDHPAIMHWVGGPSEELRADAAGVPILNVRRAPPVVVGLGSGTNPATPPFIDIIVQGDK